MKRSSSPVSSSQADIHPRLETSVRRHVAAPWRQPLHAPTVSAFERLVALPGFDPGRGLVLDSGCGTGRSTRLIADAHPDRLVIGIDRSARRLSCLGAAEFPVRRGNAVWLRAELSSFWRLALDNGWRLHRHYLLYPNPWPKPAQLQRRWHAHPVFPQLLALGGVLEMRSNWKVYAEEFERAVRLLMRGVQLRFETADSENGWDGVQTPFGTKYAASGHRLHRVIADLDSGTLA